MKKAIILLSVFALLAGGCKTKTVRPKKITDLYWIDTKGKRLTELPTGVPLSLCAETKNMKAGEVINFIVSDNAGRKYKGGIDTLKFRIAVDKKGKAYAHNIVLEFEPKTPDAGEPVRDTIDNELYLYETGEGEQEVTEEDTEIETFIELPPINEKFTACCRQTNKTADVPFPVCFTDLQTLNRLLPNIISCLEAGNEQALSDSALQQLFSDTAIYRTEDGSIRCDEDLLVVTKAIDDKHIFAIAGNNADTFLLFFRLHNGQWKEIGRRKPEISVDMLNLEELNGSGCPEIVAGTCFNMNGNSWKECFVYFPEEDTVRFAGDFCTDYTVDLENKTISEAYTGSWYMDIHKTLYGWHNDTLIALRTAIIIVPKDWNTNDSGTLEYYETYNYQYPMKLILREKYNERNKKHRKYWDDFF